MKMRRTAIVAFLLCACLVMGLGYAAISRELAINGTLHAGTRGDLQVWFVKAEIPTLAEGTNMCSVATLSLSEGADKSLTANMETANMINVGDKAVARFKIQNQETLANAVHAKLYGATFDLKASNTAFTNASEYYDVTYSFVVAEDNPTDLEHTVSIDVDADGEPIVEDLPPQYSVYLEVTVTLKKSVIDTEISHAATFTITYTAEATDGLHTHNV